MEASPVYVRPILEKMGKRIFAYVAGKVKLGTTKGEFASWRCGTPSRQELSKTPVAPCKDSGSYTKQGRSGAHSKSEDKFNCDDDKQATEVGRHEINNSHSHPPRNQTLQIGTGLILI